MRVRTFRSAPTDRATLNALADSLAYLQRIGIAADSRASAAAAAAAARGAAAARVHARSHRRRAASAIVAFTAPDAEQRFAGRLKHADVSVTLSGDRMRVSPSLFNDIRDVDRLLNALS